jgi:RNA 2',3'-cyclic 3'-phosphodiesterase
MAQQKGIRLFAAVDLGEEVRRSAARLVADLVTVAPRARWVRPQGVHLTLAFLGSTDPSRVDALAGALSAVARAHRALTLRITGGGTFGGRSRPRVLWSGVTGDVEALLALQASVVAALEPIGLERETRAFSPHLTLARSKDPRGDPDLANCAGSLAGQVLGEAAVDRLILYRSQPGPGGSVYTALAEPPLERR